MIVCTWLNLLVISLLLFIICFLCWAGPQTIIAQNLRKHSSVAQLMFCMGRDPVQFLASIAKVLVAQEISEVIQWRSFIKSRMRINTVIGRELASKTEHFLCMVLLQFPSLNYQIYHHYQSHACFDPSS